MSRPAGPPGPSYGPAPVPPATPAYPYPEPVVYPQLLRTPLYAWWRSLVGMVGALAWFFLGGTILLPLLVVFLAVQKQIDGGVGQSLVQAVSLKHVTPASMLWLNLVLASLALVTFALMRWLHHLRPRWLTSVRPGIRLRFFVACLGISVIAMAVQVILAAALPTGDPGGASPDPGGSLNHLGGQALAFALVVVLTTPLQALGEEYVFRGYLMQAIGSLFERWNLSAAAVTLGVSSLLFAIAHGSQDVPLFFDRFAFGLLAGYLVIKVGGLEAGIALHIVNNLVAFGAALLFSDITTVLTVSDVSWWIVPVTVVQSLVYLALVLLVARRMGLRERTGPPPEETSATAPGGPSLPIGDGSA